MASIVVISLIVIGILIWIIVDYRKSLTNYEDSQKQCRRDLAKCRETGPPQPPTTAVVSGESVRLSYAPIADRQKTQRIYCGVQDTKIVCSESSEGKGTAWVLEKESGASGNKIKSSDIVVIKNVSTGNYCREWSCDAKGKNEATRYRIYSLSADKVPLGQDREIRYNDYSFDWPGIVLRPLDGERYCRYDEESSSIVCDTANVDDAIFYLNAV